MNFEVKLNADEIVKTVNDKIREDLKNKINHLKDEIISCLNRGEFEFDYKDKSIKIPRVFRKDKNSCYSYSKISYFINEKEKALICNIMASKDENYWLELIVDIGYIYDLTNDQGLAPFTANILNFVLKRQKRVQEIIGRIEDKMKNKFTIKEICNGYTIVTIDVNDFVTDFPNFAEIEEAMCAISNKANIRLETDEINTLRFYV